MIQPKTRRKRHSSPGYMIKIDSALARVGALTAEMRRCAILHGERYQHTAALKHACALLEPPIGLSTYYRYRMLRNEYHSGGARNWLRYLTGLETGRSANHGSEE